MEPDTQSHPQPLEGFFDSYLLLSTMLKQAVEKLMSDGWNEEHARDIAVAALVMSSRKLQPEKKSE